MTTVQPAGATQPASIAKPSAHALPFSCFGNPGSQWQSNIRSNAVTEVTITLCMPNSSAQSVGQFEHWYAMGTANSMKMTSSKILLTGRAV